MAPKVVCSENTIFLEFTKWLLAVLIKQIIPLWLVEIR